MNYIHREGYASLLLGGLFLLLLNFLFTSFIDIEWFNNFLLLKSFILFGLLVYFFRNPALPSIAIDNNLVIAPAEGKVVVIEETEETEYFKDKRLQISIFMSPLNVHVNRSPISGTVSYTKYHTGKYLVAWHPKSSTENERHTSVIRRKNDNTEILVRQIAGKLARKIKNYLNVNDSITQKDEFGFIKLGSRVDIFLPLDSEVKVNLNDKVKGGQSVLARLPK
ncbi:MAG: phosphatidylserine decarboxylase family protein [Chitinophagales bacterium]